MICIKNNGGVTIFPFINIIIIYLQVPEYNKLVTLSLDLVIIFVNSLEIYSNLSDPLDFFIYLFILILKYSSCVLIKFTVLINRIKGLTNWLILIYLIKAHFWNVSY